MLKETTQETGGLSDFLPLDRDFLEVHHSLQTRQMVTEPGLDWKFILQIDGWTVESGGPTTHIGVV
jgi:hypothetical protein